MAKRDEWLNWTDRNARMQSLEVMYKLFQTITWCWKSSLCYNGTDVSINLNKRFLAYLISRFSVVKPGNTQQPKQPSSWHSNHSYIPQASHREYNQFHDTLILKRNEKHGKNNNKKNNLKNNNLVIFHEYVRKRWKRWNF